MSDENKEIRNFIIIFIIVILAVVGIYFFTKFVVKKEDTNGNITMVKANVIAINRIASELTLEIQKALENEKETIIYIPAGSFFGNEIFYNVGPRIPIRLTSTGIVTINLEAKDELYNQILKEIVGVDVNTRADIITLFQEYNEAKQEYDQIKNALKMVKSTGYGVSAPTINDMKLDTPEVVKQGSRYGIKLKAVAPSIHMIRVDVESTFEPIIGTEMQSKELIDYLMKDQENIWKSEIFGRSLDSIVKEGIQAKLALLPENARYKLQTTLTKLVNKGSGNLFTLVI